MTSNKLKPQECLSRMIPSELADRLKDAGLELEISVRDKSGSEVDPEILTRLCGDLEGSCGGGTAMQKMAAMGDLCAGVSHEARNIMTGVLGFAQVAKERIDDRKAVQEFLALIEQESVRCVELLSSYLDLAHDQKRNFHPVKVREVVEQAVRLVAYQTRQKHCKVEVQVEKDVPVVRARSVELRQALINLLVNAIQAVNEGGNVAIRASRQPDDSVSIEVIDDGPGVPEEIQKKIFEAYYSTKPRGEGVGLGLYISRKMIEEQEGSLTVRSAAGKGATFAIRLPVYRISSEAAKTSGD